ncbi:MAG TPA: hypothetical protein EYG97_01755 [Arcobacter sp.]|nr:hypothetical protein [Arcobacter sp.]
MSKKIFMDKYPIYSIEIQNNNTNYTTIDEIINHLKILIENHKIATFISIFDHYSHTVSINGEINSSIKDAKNLIFCFGAAIPNTEIMAVRPRSFGISKLEDSFKIEFLEAPKEQLTVLMQEWANTLNNKG